MTSFVSLHEVSTELVKLLELLGAHHILVSEDSRSIRWQRADLEGEFSLNILSPTRTSGPITVQKDGTSVEILHTFQFTHPGIVRRLNEMMHPPIIEPELKTQHRKVS